MQPLLSTITYRRIRTYCLFTYCLSLFFLPSQRLLNQNYCPSFPDQETGGSEWFCNLVKVTQLLLVLAGGGWVSTIYLASKLINFLHLRSYGTYSICVAARSGIQRTGAGGEAGSP